MGLHLTRFEVSGAVEKLLVKTFKLKATATIGLLLIVLFNACAILGDSPQVYKRKAEKAYSQRDYASALAFSQSVLETDSQEVDALYTGGESARHLREYDVALLYLERIPEAQKTGDLADADYGIANAKLAKGEYDEAVRLYQKFLQGNSANKALVLKAQEELNYANWALKYVNKDDQMLVAHLDEHVNSGFPEFAPLRFADKLYFSSSYTNDTITTPVTRIFSSIQGGPAKLYEVNTNDKNLHSAHIALTSDARRMYYTICEGKPGNNGYRCAIYSRDKQYEGHWGPPKKLPRQINLDTFTTTQPTIGYDKMLKKEVLYFATNRPGGAGSMDIWGVVVEKDGSYGEPFPLPFNTAEDDITPFFHQQSQVLYFSSNGQESFGGYDVYRTEKNAEGWEKPENVGPPISSSYDDLYYTFHTGSGMAYFASNRPDRFSPTDPDKSSTDIYKAKIKVDLNVAVFSPDKDQQKGVTLELTDLGTGQVDTVANLPSGGPIALPLQLEKNYRVSATMEGYLTDKADISTEGISSFTTIKKSLYLRPGMVLVVRTFNAADKAPLYGTTIELTEGSSGKNVLYQNTPNSYQSSFPLELGKEYSVTASKSSFSTQRASTSTLGQNNPDTIYQDVFLQSSHYLPLTLYFDNDKPGYGSWTDTTTPLTYEQTYLGYLSRKPLFISEFSAGLAGSAKEAADAEIRAFFEKEVEASFTKLQAFSEWLVGYLKGGNKVDLLISGNASPLASAEYNQRLISRRINSVENHFRKYKGGTLQPWISDGSLTFKRDTFSEIFNSQNVSSDGTNRRLSEFSPAASKLRRVTISRLVSPDSTGVSTK